MAGSFTSARDAMRWRAREGRQDLERGGVEGKEAAGVGFGFGAAAADRLLLARSVHLFLLSRPGTPSRQVLCVVRCGRTRLPLVGVGSGGKSNRGLLLLLQFLRSQDSRVPRSTEYRK